MSEKNIYQRVNAVMNDCNYLQKKAAQQGKGIKYDEVIAMLREHLINHGVVMTFNQSSMELLGGVEGTKQKVYQGSYAMTLTNMDKPDQTINHTVFAQGMDGGDKAPGKAFTYAVKMMLVKGFAIETGEDEESRAEKEDKKNVIDNDQYTQLSPYCLENINNQIQWSRYGAKVAKAYKINTLNELPETKFLSVLEGCKAYANNK
jgi:hypothetical protein